MYVFGICNLIACSDSDVSLLAGNRVLCLSGCMDYIGLTFLRLQKEKIKMQVSPAEKEYNESQKKATD